MFSKHCIQVMYFVSSAHLLIRLSYNENMTVEDILTNPMETSPFFFPPYGKNDNTGQIYLLWRAQKEKLERASYCSVRRRATIQRYRHPSPLWNFCWCWPAVMVALQTASFHSVWFKAFWGLSADGAPRSQAGYPLIDSQWSVADAARDAGNELAWRVSTERGLLAPRRYRQCCPTLMSPCSPMEPHLVSNQSPLWIESGEAGLQMRLWIIWKYIQCLEKRYPSAHWGDISSLNTVPFQDDTNMTCFGYNKVRM